MVHEQRFFITFLSLFISFSAFAQPRPIPKKLKTSHQEHAIAEVKKLSLLNQQFEVGLNHSFHRYDEPGLMKITGNQWGIDLAYNWYDETRDYRIRSELEYLLGTFRYDGSTCDTMGNCSPATENGKESYRTIRATLGKTFQEVPGSLFTGYGGLAQRYLDNKIGGSSSYRREITYYYAPLGFEYASLIAPTFRIRTWIEYDFFIYGIVKSHLSEVPGYNDLTNHQRSGYGAKLASAFDWSVDSATISFQPYLQYWNIPDSDIATTSTQFGTFEGKEPKNHTITGGLVVSLLF